MTENTSPEAYALYLRADQLDNEAVSAEVIGATSGPGRTPGTLRVIAAEMRRLAAIGAADLRVETTGPLTDEQRVIAEEFRTVSRMAEDYRKHGPKP